MGGRTLEDCHKVAPIAPDLLQQFAYLVQRVGGDGHNVTVRYEVKVRGRKVGAVRRGNGVGGMKPEGSQRENG